MTRCPKGERAACSVAFNAILSSFLVSKRPTIAIMLKILIFKVCCIITFFLLLVITWKKWKFIYHTRANAAHYVKIWRHYRNDVRYNNFKDYIITCKYLLQQINCSRNIILNRNSLFRPSQSSSRLTKNNLRELRSEAVPGSFPFAPCKVESFPKSLRSPPTFGFSWHSWPVVLKSPFSFQLNRWSEPNRKNRSSLSAFLFVARYISLILF